MANPFVDIIQKELKINCNQSFSVEVEVVVYNAGECILCINLPELLPCYFKTPDGSLSNSICKKIISIASGEKKVVHFNLVIHCQQSDTYWFNLIAVATDSKKEIGTDKVKTVLTC